jgi:hypothetical protein
MRLQISAPNSSYPYRLFTSNTERGSGAREGCDCTHTHTHTHERERERETMGRERKRNDRQDADREFERGEENKERD